MAQSIQKSEKREKKRKNNKNGMVVDNKSIFTITNIIKNKADKAKNPLPGELVQR